MDSLRKLTLDYNEQKKRWDLEEDRTHRLIKTFGSKADALEGGALRDVLGPAGGSVKIQKRDGKFQEERTYPRSRDPRGSRG